MSEVSLLESFPSPPTHIPNPPPSLPPSFPLPPLPGPSPISDNFLRRSIASHRDSIASFATREDAVLSPPDHLFGISISPYPLSDIDDDDDDDDHTTGPRNDESISDIQLPLTEDEEDDSALTASNASDTSIADPIDPLTLHLQKRPSPRRHRNASSSSFSANVAGKNTPNPRSVSPDIQAILSKTPRPRKQRSSNFSKTVGATAASRPLPRRVSDGDIAIQSNRRAKNALYSFASDHRVTFPNPHLNEAEIEENLGRRVQGGDSDSDSSIDIHTPLPHLMVRDGLLSPRSKLLPPLESTSFDFRGSVCSIASNTSSVTKSGILKDIRDTPMRRHRHRDGKLLRGGIGLTTGLGWSDSEDEDAPSPLTRRLSSLNLSRRASASSVHSAHSHPLSRSISGSRVLEEPEDYDAYDLPVRQRSNTLSISPRYSTKHPPTSWQSRPHPGGSRLSSGSAGSKDSIQLSVSEQSDYATVLRRSASGSDNGFQDILNTSSTASSLSIPTPTTPSDEPILRASVTTGANKNKSLPPLPPSLRRIPSNISLTSIKQGARPRTISATSSISSHSLSTVPVPPLSASGSVTPRPLKLTGIQTRQSQSQPQTPIFRGGGVDRPAVPVPSISSTGPGPRPLAVSTSSPSIASASRSLPRPVSRLPNKSPTSLTAGSSPLPSPMSASYSVSDMPIPPKPKPRIGSGMVYRTSSYSGLDANSAGGSRLRTPKSLTLTTTVQAIPSPRSASTSLPSRAGMFRTSAPRTVAS